MQRNRARRNILVMYLLFSSIIEPPILATIYLSITFKFRVGFLVGLILLLVLDVSESNEGEHGCGTEHAHFLSIGTYSFIVAARAYGYGVEDDGHCDEGHQLHPLVFGSP